MSNMETKKDFLQQLVAMLWNSPAMRTVNLTKKHTVLGHKKIDCSLLWDNVVVHPNMNMFNCLMRLTHEIQGRTST